MTRLHRCSPYDMTYTTRGAYCEACGRTWRRGPWRYEVTAVGSTSTEPSLEDRRKAALYE